MSVGLFRILGPVMVGPSSSHTAGAVRIGNVARAVSKGKAKKVKFYLHGSFRNTYKGHGTDRALVAGVLGFEPDDERIIDSLSLAKEEGLEFEFIKADLGSVHPNTVKIEMFDENKEKTSIVASSIGGGEIRVTSVNSLKVETNFIYNTVIIEHKKTVEILCNILDIIKELKINLMSLTSNCQNGSKDQSITVLEFNNEINKINLFLTKLEEFLGIKKITTIEKV